MTTTSTVIAAVILSLSLYSGLLIYRHYQAQSYLAHERNLFESRLKEAEQSIRLAESQKHLSQFDELILRVQFQLSRLETQASSFQPYIKQLEQTCPLCLPPSPPIKST